MEELFKKGMVVVFVKKRSKQLVMHFKAVIVVATSDGRIMGIINKVDVNLGARI